MSSFGASGSYSASNAYGLGSALASGSAIASGSNVAASLSSSAIASGSNLYNNSLYASGSYAPASASYAPASASFNTASASYAPASASYAPASASFNTASASYLPASRSAPILARRQSAAPALAARTLALNAAPALASNFAVPDNVDSHPLVVRKKPAAPVNYTQQVSVKFLQPPPPQQPGDIVITQQKDVQAAPVAPRLIRQNPPLPVKPAPMIVRERPPLAPAPIAPEHHVIPGKVIPPPPRKVITERLPQLPQPPQDIVVERWLEYGPRARRVVFQPAPKLIPAPAPKNVLIQWDSPNVALNRQFRNLGIQPANPAQYVATFGASLVLPSQIPALAQGVKPVGAILAAESSPKPVTLVGDVAALSLINRGSAHLAAAAPAGFFGSASANLYAAPSTFSQRAVPARSLSAAPQQAAQSTTQARSNVLYGTQQNRSAQALGIHSRAAPRTAQVSRVAQALESGTSKISRSVSAVSYRDRSLASAQFTSIPNAQLISQSDLAFNNNLVVNSYPYNSASLSGSALVSGSYTSY